MEAARRSPYLEAIQAIPGETPGEKHKELNAIARRIAASESETRGDTATNSDEVPEALLPLVQVEIAKVLRRNEGIVRALVSQDSTVVGRALRAKWFFREANRDSTSVRHFDERLLPRVSLDTRVKLFKKLAKALSSTKQGGSSSALAEEFYLRVAETYGRTEAEPLFVACSESFVYDTVVRHNIVLSIRTLQRLFVKCPDTVVRYLKLSEPSEQQRRRWSRNVFRVDIARYANFLPRLIKNNVNAFVDLIEMHDFSFGLRLSNKATERFLKNNVDAVLNKPQLYTSMMPLKVIAAKLTKAQYNGMLPKLFPKRVEDFSYRAIKKYLVHCPERERLTVVVESYRAVYKANLVENHGAVCPELLCMLPSEERARQARAKLSDEPNWRNERWDVTRSWRCYLPIGETIPAIIDEISKSSSADDRSTLIRQLIYTCKVNDDDDDDDDDKGALLKVLEYLTSRHRNEQAVLIFNVMDFLVSTFDLSAVGKSHWAVLNDFIRFLRVKGLFLSPSASTNLLAAGVQFNLIHDLPISDLVDVIVETKVEGSFGGGGGGGGSWSLIPKHSEHDRRCIDACLTAVPLKYPSDSRVWANRELTILSGIVESMRQFNGRISVKANSKAERRLTIKSYPWIIEGVEKLVKDGKSRSEFNCREWTTLVECLRENEKDLYDAWLVDPNGIARVENGEALSLLGREPRRILERWEEYLIATRSNIHVPRTRRFVRVCRWYQDLPMKFTASCLKSVATDTRCGDSLIVLGILMEGSAYARVVEPLLPKGATIDGDEAKSRYEAAEAVSRASNLTDPPVPLKLVASLCRGDYVNLGLISLTNVCRRTSVDAVKEFARVLVGARVSVKKHGIRTFCLVASMEERRRFLSERWRTEKHRSIRAVVFERIYAMFVKEPSPETWTMMKSCIGDLRSDDDDGAVLRVVVNFSSISNEYVADYASEVMGALERLAKNGLDTASSCGYVLEALQRIDGSVSKLFPEDFSTELLRKYFCNPSANLDLNDEGTRYAVRSYLEPAEARLESRLKVICGLYEEALRNNWNVPHRKCSTFYPINYQTRRFVSELVYDRDVAEKKRILEAIRRSFLAVLSPEEDIVAYVLLSYGLALDGLVAHQEIALKLREILPELIETLSPVLTLELAEITSAYVNRSSSVSDDSGQRDSLMYRIIETLHRSDSLYLCILAAKLVFRSDDRKLHPRYDKIVEALRRSPYPSVVSLVQRHCNGCRYLD